MRGMSYYLWPVLCLGFCTHFDWEEKVLFEIAASDKENIPEIQMEIFFL